MVCNLLKERKNDKEKKRKKERKSPFFLRVCLCVKRCFRRERSRKFQDEPFFYFRSVRNKEKRKKRKKYKESKMRRMPKQVKTPHTTIYNDKYCF
ncbi:hypothetical protein WH47_01352 [Habropoda laboriosa]|uniref:Uncharacterized protein n=1 Tax=Habropoda laboriosa TaxID=597456 RepID=A0A0L7R2U9_9HYME|nr:hypothetical protein WH47_01352 [Habropoda laboriosa]